jgi:hypothetical protein
MKATLLGVLISHIKRYPDRMCKRSRSLLNGYYSLRLNVQGMVVKATRNMRRKLTNYYMLLVNNLHSSSPVLRKSHQI